MKSKTTISEHLKFALTTISLMGAWVAAMLWLLTINR